MEKTQNNYRVIGVMSGTSLDGLDLVEVCFKKDNTWTFKVINAVTYSYNSYWQQRLAEAHTYTDYQIKKLSHEFAELTASYCLTFIKEFKCRQIDFISAHGHTVLHQPDRGVTLQIGNLPVLAQKTKLPVYCDFRVQDVKLGGQGAPLVPIGDQLLFGHYQACLNIGGFANISYQSHDKRIAYDVCAANKVINNYTTKYFNQDFDRDGEIAKSSTLYEPLYQALNQLAYFSQSPPKSLGLEWVEDQIFPLIDSYNLNPAQIISTFTHHIAYQIVEHAKDFKHVLVTGGGIHNKYLFKLLQQFLKEQLILPSTNLIDFKEAVIFAFLGVLKHRNEINCLAAVTGAKQDHSSGVFFNPS